MLARFSSHRGKLLLGDSGFDSTHSVANDDRTIKVEGNVLFLAIYVTPIYHLYRHPHYIRKNNQINHIYTLSFCAMVGITLE